jgi:hypothetical protein
VLGTLTVRTNVLVFVMPPPEAVTVTFEVPAGVEAVVPTVRVEEHAGLQEGVEKDPTDPAGNPETLNATD